MWILIIKDIPVQQEYKPEFLGIYWAVPWDVDIDRLVSVIIKDEYLRMDVLRHFDVDFYPTGSGTLYSKVMAFVIQNKRKVVDYISNLNTVLFDLYGRMDNPTQKMRVTIGKESVGVLSYEYSKLTSEHMRAYLEEGTHTFIAEAGISQEIVLLTKRQSFIKDAAMVDGCTKHQANMVALGKDPEINFPPPLGWYKPNHEIVEMFL